MPGRSLISRILVSCKSIILDIEKEFDYIYLMKNRFFKFEHSIIIVAPFLLLSLFLSSIILTSFHEHHCDGTSDDCAICRFQTSSFTMPATPVSAGALFSGRFPNVHSLSTTTPPIRPRSSFALLTHRRNTPNFRSKTITP